MQQPQLLSTIFAPWYETGTEKIIENYQIIRTRFDFYSLMSIILCLECRCSCLAAGNIHVILMINCPVSTCSDHSGSILINYTALGRYNGFQYCHYTALGRYHGFQYCHYTALGRYHGFADRGVGDLSDPGDERRAAREREQVDDGGLNDLHRLILRPSTGFVYDNSKYSIMLLYSPWLRRSFGFETAALAEKKEALDVDRAAFRLSRLLRSLRQPSGRPCPRPRPPSSGRGRSQNQMIVEVKECILTLYCV